MPSLALPPRRLGVLACFLLLSLGARAGSGPPADELELLATWSGPSPASRFGAAVAGGGDHDGDGVPDVLVGARAAAGAGAGVTAGEVTVFSGAHAGALLFLDGSDPGGWYGAAVAALPDLDGDGCDEIVVGAPYGAGGRGVVTVHGGADGVELLRVTGPTDGGRFGEALAAVGDVDGDGLADLAVGASTDDGGGLLAGRACVVAGADGRVLWEVAGAPGDLLGRAVAAAGDVDGDGVGDVLVGAPLADAGAFNSGRVSVHSGADGAVLLLLDGTELGAQLGDRVARVGDLDGDGRGDFALSAPAADAGGLDSGALELRSSADGRLLRTVAGSGPGRTLQAVADAGDHDHDGVGDVAVGEALGGVSQSGAVRIVSGRTGTTLAALTGPGPAAWLGAALASAGDVDGDGRRDLVVGAPASDDDLLLPGAAWLVRGGGERAPLQLRLPRRR